MLATLVRRRLVLFFSFFSSSTVCCSVLVGLTSQIAVLLYPVPSVSALARSNLAAALRPAPTPLHAQSPCRTCPKPSRTCPKPSPNPIKGVLLVSRLENLPHVQTGCFWINNDCIRLFTPLVDRRQNSFSCSAAQCIPTSGLALWGFMQVVLLPSSAEMEIQNFATSRQCKQC